MKFNKQLVYTGQRHFAPPKPAAGGKGGPPAAAPPAPVKETEKTPLQRLIASGAEFPLGVPAGAHIKHGAHRDHVAPKLAPRIEIYAKKLRDFYLREGLIMESKVHLDYERIRQPEDTLEKLFDNSLVAGIVEAREEFPDLDLVFPM